MGNRKISELAAPGPLTGAEEVPVVQDGETVRPPLSATADYAVKTAASFAQEGPGTVARSVQSKAQDTKSIFDYMTDGERADVTSGLSVLDHTAAIDAALTSGFAIEFPSGIFNATKITLRDGTQMFGAGNVAGRSGVSARKGTLIRSLDSAEPDFIVMPVGKVRGVVVSGFTIQGDIVNNPTQDGFDLVGVVSGADGGLWDFKFSNLFVKDFGGDGFKLVGGHLNTNSPVQFGLVSHVYVERPVSTARALVLMGQVEHVEFLECRFDGISGLGAVGTGSYMGRVPTLEDIRPNSISFTNSTFQRASIGIEVDRCEGVTFQNPWFETVTTGVNQKSSSTGLVLDNPRFANVTTGIAVGTTCRATVRDPVVSGSMTALVAGGSHNGVVVESPSKTGITSTGVNYAVSVPSGATVDVKAHRFAPFSFGSGLTINTIDGFHQAGELVTIFVSGNSVTFGGGGNLALGGIGSSVVVETGNTITFMRTDTASILPWRLVALSKTVLPVMPAQGNSGAADVATLRGEFNSLLGRLRTAGYMAP